MEKTKEEKVKSEKKKGKDKFSIEIDKEKAKKIVFVIAIVLIALLVFFGIQNKFQKIYNRGYEDGMSDGTNNIIASQSKTGEIYLLVNNSIRKIPIEELCRNTGTKNTTM